MERGCQQRRDCHSADNPSPSLLKNLLKGEGGCQRSDSLAVTARYYPEEVDDVRARLAQKHEKLVKAAQAELTQLLHR